MNNCLVAIVMALQICAWLVGPREVRAETANAQSPPLHAVSPGDLQSLATRLNDPALSRLSADVRYLGYGTFAEVKLLPETVDVLAAIKNEAEGREEVAGKRHFFAYDEFVVTVQDGAEVRLEMVLRTAAALERIKSKLPDAYRYMVGMKEYSTAPPMSATSWKNRYERIFISYDRTPGAIAAAVQVVGAATQEEGVNYYTNYALISIDADTILGETKNRGSAAIYGKASAPENYRAYMADGLLYTLLHEATHLQIDYTNSVSRLANAIYLQRKMDGATDAEEIVANETGMSLAGSILSPEMRRHVMVQNVRLVKNSNVRTRLEAWSGVATRSKDRLVVPDDLHQ